jgi:hypothetical protein
MIAIDWILIFISTSAHEKDEASSLPFINPNPGSLAILHRNELLWNPRVVILVFAVWYVAKGTPYIYPNALFGRW